MLAFFWDFRHRKLDGNMLYLDKSRVKYNMGVFSLAWELKLENQEVEKQRQWELRSTERECKYGGMVRPRKQAGKNKENRNEIWKKKKRA